jgi:hypothetical protein
MPAIQRNATKLGKTLAKAGAKPLKPRSREPLWKGPHVDGVTQSMMCAYLGCKERFYVRVVEGLRPPMGFNHYIEYGQMWHTCEEALAGGKQDWKVELAKYCAGLCKQHKGQQAQVNKWFNVCKAQFPHYVNFWKKHPDVKDRTPLLQEQTFKVPYRLPDSGRVVILRGKFDAFDLIGKGRAAGIYLQENKTKSDPKPEQIKRQLGFDIQTMTYLTAFHTLQDYALNGTDLYDGTNIEPPGEHFGNVLGVNKPLLGVRYNVIRRPLSGGKGSIVQLKAKTPKNGKHRPAETDAEYYARLSSIIAAEPHEFFMRWKVDITQSDIERFQQRFLHPHLEELCDWWEWVQGGDRWRAGNRLHTQHPFGTYNVLDEGGATELDEYLANGSEVGLERAEKLFTEL